MRGRRWWNPAFAANLGRAAFFVFLVLYLGSMSFGEGGRDAFGRAMMPDFAIFYVVGEQVWNGEAAKIYDWEATWQRVEALAPQDDGGSLLFLYPPLDAWLCVPLAWLPYDVTKWVYLVLNLLLGLGLGWSIAHRFFPDKAAARAACWLFVGSVPFWLCILFGQNGLISLGIMWLGWLMFEKGRGVEAGLCWSLGVYKPQLFFGLWLWGMLFGSWRLRFGLVLGGGALLGASVAVAGVEGFVQWRETVNQMVVFPGTALNRFSFLDGAYMLGFYEHASANIAWAVLGLFWGGILGWAWWHHLWGASESFIQTSLAFAVTGWMVVVPRMGVYDMPIFFPIIVGGWLALGVTPNLTKAVLVVTILLGYLGTTAAAVGVPLYTLLTLGWTCYLGWCLAKEIVQQHGMDSAKKRSKLR